MRITTILGGVAFAALVACGGDDSSTLDAGTIATVSKLIGREGGTIELAGGKVEIPPDALEAATKITITKLELDDVAPLPIHLEAAGKPFAFEPHGTMFKGPVKITLPFEGDATQVRPVKLDDHEDTTWQTIVGATKTNDSKLEISTASFSIYLAARPRRNSGLITLDDGAVLDGAQRDGATLDGGTITDARVPRDATTHDATVADASGDATVVEQDAAVDPDAGGNSAFGQEAYVKASNTNTADAFATSLSISGDTLIVGAPWEASATSGVNGDQSDNTATNAGAAYVFARAGTWVQQAYLKASNQEATDSFGIGVAASGNTVVVGASLEDSSAVGVNGDESDNTSADSGAAYVFIRSGSTWTQQAYLKASNTDPNDQFGSVVAISGDTIAIAAQREASGARGVNGIETDNGATYSGAVYIFVRSGSTWTQQAYLKSSNSSAFDNFGFSLAIDGDTLVVGARYEESSATGVDGNQNDNGALDSGAAYVFVRTGVTWTQQAYLKASNTETLDEFGAHVALSGDTVVVGSELERSAATGINGDQSSNTAISSGAAYVFVRSGVTWSQEAYVKASNTVASDRFGSSVAIDGDLLAIGARGKSRGYLFSRSGGQWSEQRIIQPNRAVSAFGLTGAISGDTIVFGTPLESGASTGINGDDTGSGATNSGAAYVFR